MKVSFKLFHVNKVMTCNRTFLYFIICDIGNQYEDLRTMTLLNVSIHPQF